MKTIRTMTHLLLGLAWWNNGGRANKKSHISRLGSTFSLSMAALGFLWVLTPVLVLVAAIGVNAADVNVSNSLAKDTGNEAEVSIAVNPTDPNNLVIVGHDPFDGRAPETMNTFFSKDGGKTWKPVSLGESDDKRKAVGVGRFDPSVAFDAKGNVFVAYGVVEAQAPPNQAKKQVTVVVCRSTNGGKEYQKCFNVNTTKHTNKGRVGNDKWHLATGPDGDDPTKQNVYIAWNQLVDETAGVDKRVVLSRLKEGEEKFSEPVIVNKASREGTSDENVFPQPAVGPQGEVYVVWYSISDEKVLLAISDDGGKKFTEREVAKIDPKFKDAIGDTHFVGFFVQIPAQPSRGVFVGPTIDVDRSDGKFKGRLYIAYVDIDEKAQKTPDDTAIFVQFCDKKGTKCLEQKERIRVSSDGFGTSQFLPWLTVDQKTGLVGVAWYDARNDKDNKEVEVFLGVSTDGGENFHPSIKVADKPSNQSSFDSSESASNNFLEYIGLAMFNCVAFPVWSDNSRQRNNLDFFADKVATPCPVKVDAEVTRFTGKAHGVGRGENKGGIEIVGTFTVDKELDLSASAVTITRLFDEVGGAGEVVEDLPITLSATLGSKTNSAVFKTRAEPAAEMKVAEKRPGKFDFRLKVNGATIRVPGQCPATNLTTSFTINDPFDTAAVLVTAEERWRCFKRGNKFEQLRTP